MRAALLVALCCGITSFDAGAQVLLPDVTVHENSTVEHHGGYVISGDFKVDPKISSVIYPAEPLRARDVLSVQSLHMSDDEYLVLQECAPACGRRASGRSAISCRTKASTFSG